MRDDADRHGWALVSTLHGYGVDVESGRAYRILRELDEDGAVSSRWAPSSYGPRRRTYRITDDGRERLDEIAADLRATWELYDAFRRAYEQPLDDDARETAAGLAGGREDPPQRVHAATGDTLVHPQLTRQLLAAWLLLLIARDPSYGYGLRRAFENSNLHPDPSTLYRVLRQLEQTGSLGSRWTQASGGPRRRLYRISARGRRSLDDVARVIAATSETHANFLRRYDEQPTAKAS